MKTHHLYLAGISLLATLALAHDGGPEGANFGPDKGVTTVSEENGFKLSAESVKTFALGYAQVTSSGSLYQLPNSAFVFTGADVSVYRFRDGWLKRVDVQMAKKGPSLSLVNTKGLKSGDQVVSQGVSWVRVAELDGLGDEADHRDEQGEGSEGKHDDHGAEKGGHND